jgi:hypothetical protein
MGKLDLCKRIELARAILAHQDVAQLVCVAGIRRVRLARGLQGACAAHAAQIRLSNRRSSEQSSSTGCSEASLLVMFMAMNCFPPVPPAADSRRHLLMFEAMPALEPDVRNLRLDRRERL